MRCTAMGRLNGHSRKILITSPKNIAIHHRMIDSACKVAPKYDTAWMEQGLYDLRRKGHIEEQWIDPQFAGRKVKAVDALKPRTIKANFRGEYKGWGNKIHGWEKLNGMNIPIVD